MKKQVQIIISAVVLVTIMIFLSPAVVLSNSFFWQGTDVSDSGPEVGLLDYTMHKEVHDKLLEALPVLLYSDSIPDPDGGVGGNGNLNRMYGGTLTGERGLRLWDPSKTWDGYTLLGTALIDMEGNIVHIYEASTGSFGGAAKMIKGGDVISSERGNLVQRDWCGVEIKRFDGLSNHHDHQREGSAVGYNHPGYKVRTNRGVTLSLGAVTVSPTEDFVNNDNETVEIDPESYIYDPATLGIVDVKRFDASRPDRPIRDDVIRELPWDWDGTNALFEWHARDHFDPDPATNPGDLGFGLAEDYAARYALDLGLNSGGSTNFWANTSENRQGLVGIHAEDWSHGNSAAWLGKNKWFKRKYKGKRYIDYRFHLDNIIADFRSLNTTIIIARHDHPDGDWLEGDIVWRLGPHYGTDGPDGKVGQIIGQHMAYMIPNGLPGAGNILVFDNGGGAGYGALIEGLTDPITEEKLGFWPNKYRTFSRVLEINPMTKQLVWQYVQAKPTEGDGIGNNHIFFSNIMAGAQRLKNGNTLITEADTGRLFEVTEEGDVVWEYAKTDDIPGQGPFASSTYRAYRIPYSWVHPELLRDHDVNGVYDVCE